MKLCVAIETTGDYLGLALYRLDTPTPKPVAVVMDRHAQRQSDLLIPTLERMLKKTKAKLTDIALVAVDVGPGSFTGVRVGVSTARTLAQALNLPLIGVSSLEAAAWKAAVQPGKTRLLSSRPALKGEIYWAAYEVSRSGGRKNLRELKTPRWTTLEDYEKMRRSGGFTEIQDEPHPAAVAERAIQIFQSHPRADHSFEKTVPLYLQPSWAERKRRS